MDKPAAAPVKFARIRDWFARHLVAIVATCAVFGAFGCKNKYRNSSLGGLDLWEVIETGDYGWPQTCVGEISTTEVDTPSNSHVLKSREYSIESWWGLCLDVLVAVAFMGATWIIFTRTQRNIRNWRQLSLRSLLGLVALAGLLFAMF